MVAVLDVLALAEGSLAILLAVFLIGRGLNNPARWVLGGLLFNFGLFALFLSVPALLEHGFPSQGIHFATQVSRAAFISLNLAFAVVYPDLALAPAKRAWLALALLPSALLVGLLITNPQTVLETYPRPSLTTQLINVLLVASHLPALWVFSRHWLTAEPGLYRDQYVFVLIAYLLWNLADAVYTIAVGIFDPLQFGLPFLGLALLLSLLQLFGVLFIAIATPVRASAARRDATRQERVVVTSIFLGLGLAFVQFLGPRGPVVVGGLILPLLFYGAARFQLVDLDLRLKTSLPYGVLVAAASGAVFLLEETAQYYATGPYGYVGGLVAAGLVLLALLPLRRVAKQWVNRLMPGVQPTADYFDRRRIELYRAALEGHIRDRVLDTREAHALAALRQELGVSLPEHAALEQKIRARLGGAA